MWHWVHCTGGEVEMARWLERWQPFQLVLGQQDVANSTPAAPPPTFCKNNLARLCKGFVCVLGDNESSKLVLSDRQTDRQSDIQTEFFFTDRCNQPLIVVTSSAIPLSVPTIGSSHWHQLYLTKSLTMTNTCWLTFIFLLQNTVMHNTHTMSSLDVLFCSGNGQWCIGEMPL